MPRPSRNGDTPALLADLRTKDKLLASMHKISSLLTRPIPLDRILTAIVRETCLVFGFTRMAVFLANPARTLLECRYIHGFNAHDSERAFRLPYRLLDQDCVETRVARHGCALYVRDYHTDPRVTAIDLVVSRIMGRVSTVAVPLKIKRDVIGLITADKDAIPLKLGRKEIDALATFANQVSIVIENARLQEQMNALERLRNKQYRQLELFYQEKRQVSRKEEERREIDRKFDEFIHWVEDTMTTEDNPFIQVIAVLRGEAQ